MKEYKVKYGVLIDFERVVEAEDKNDAELIIWLWLGAKPLGEILNSSSPPVDWKDHYIEAEELCPEGTEPIQ